MILHPENPSTAMKPGTTLLAVVGPTAVGKTALAVTVAPELKADIISVDSMQVYRGMDIGTSKPRVDERRGVEFHAIDVADPARDFSAAEYKSIAVWAAEDIVGRGRSPLLVGGSGLYFRAVVDDLDFGSAPGDRGERESRLRRTAGMTPVELHRELERLDPVAAAAIPSANVRRVLRAMEVIQHGKRLPSSLQKSWLEYRSQYNLIAVGLEMDRALLYRAIDRRVDDMMSRGLLEEVRTLSEGKLCRGTTAGEAIGYRQLLDYLEGLCNLDDAVDTIKKLTRNYAKRQLTWFRKDPRIKWFEVGGGGSPAVAALVLEYVSDKLEN